MKTLFFFLLFIIWWVQLLPPLSNPLISQCLFGMWNFSCAIPQFSSLLTIDVVTWERQYGICDDIEFQLFFLYLLYACNAVECWYDYCWNWMISYHRIVWSSRCHFGVQSPPSLVNAKLKRLTFNVKDLYENFKVWVRKLHIQSSGRQAQKIKRLKFN